MANRAEIGVGIHGDATGVRKTITDLGGCVRQTFTEIRQIVAAQFAVSSLVNFGKEAIALAGQITDMAQRSGVSTDAFQALGYAARMAGAGEEELGAALNKLRNAQAEALSGSKAAENAFAALGISLSDLAELDVEQTLERMAQALVAAHSSGAELAAVFDLIGAKQAPKLLEMMEKLGAVGMGGMLAEAKAQWQVIDGDMLKRFDEMGDRMDRVKRVAAGVFMTLVGWGIKAYSAIQPLWTILGSVAGVGLRETLRQIRTGELETFTNTGKAILGEDAYGGVEAEKSTTSDAQRNMNRATLAATLAEREREEQEKAAKEREARTKRIEGLYAEIARAQERAGATAGRESTNRLELAGRIEQSEREIARLREVSARASDEEKRLQMKLKMVEAQKALTELLRQDARLESEAQEAADEAATAGIERRLSVQGILDTAATNIAAMRAAPGAGNVPASAVNRIGGTLGGSARPDIAAAQRSQQTGQQILTEVKRANAELAKFGVKITNLIGVD